jgi:GntR family transcriptional regulator
MLSTRTGPKLEAVPSRHEARSLRVCPQTHNVTLHALAAARNGFVHKPAIICPVEARPTPVEAPIQLRIADDIRMRIERGELQPGDSLPTLAQLCDRWDCSMNSARGAVNLLKAQGLITAGRGRAPIVRIPPVRVIRSSERHQIEKDLAVRPPEERAAVGEAETNLAMSITEQHFTAAYDLVPAEGELAALLRVDPGTMLLRRRFESADRHAGMLLSASVSHIPKSLVERNPALLDERNEPWPGGTQHQLATVGIEITCMIDRVSARMPTTVEARQWGLPDGVPLLFCRRLAIDQHDRTVEISDAHYSADRTELRFSTPLNAWGELPADWPRDSEDDGA